MKATVYCASDDIAGLMKPGRFSLHLPSAKIQQGDARVAVCRVEGRAEAVVGEALFLSEDGTVISTIANTRPARAALIDAQAALRDNRSFTMRYSLPEGAIDLCVEWLFPDSLTSIGFDYAGCIPLQPPKIKNFSPLFHSAFIGCANTQKQAG